MSREAISARLIAEAQASIALLHRHPDWVRPSTADLDVAVIGGGQSGAGIAFALARAGISRVAVFDAAPEGRAGVWATTARMETLRTDKSISGLDQGIPELGFARWFDALEGEGAFARLTRIPRLTWSEYLDWLKQAMGVSVRHDARLMEVRPDPAGLALIVQEGGVTIRITARRLVLATGVDGLGARFVPEAVRRSIPRERYSHTADDIDFAGLRGRRVIVLGSASSAFDAAATALEAGAAEVHLLARNAQLATVPPGSLAKNPVLYRPFRDLPDALRWKIITEGRARGHAPPATIERAQRHAGFRLHQGVSIDGLGYGNGEIRIALPAGSVSADHLIAGTGYVTDIGRRPELRAVEPHLRLWRDAMGPIAAESEWGRFPYLDRDLAFQPISAAGEWIGRIHAFNYAAVLSHGYHVGDIGSHADSVARLVEGLGHRLFAEEADAHLAAAGHELSSAIAKPAALPVGASIPGQPAGAERAARLA